MSQLVQRACRPTSTRPHLVASQRRLKTFQRHVDRNNEVYYKLEKRRPPYDPSAVPEAGQIFDMPDLLLDLDAEGSHNVRTFEDEDEELLRAKWRVNPKQEEVKIKLNGLETQLMESRRKAQDVVANPSNIWRLTSHDLLSAALHGLPDQSAGETTGTACPDTLEGTHLIEALRRENGIPGHVSASDVLLLEWMLLRRHNGDSAKSRSNEGPMTSSALVQALQSQSSISGIRRLLLHNLRSWASLKSHFGLPNEQFGTNSDLAHQLRKKCIAILDAENVTQSQILGCLGLVSSLVERLKRAGVRSVPRLHGLGLRTAAQSGSVSSIFAWIDHIHEDGTWNCCVEIVEDVMACMENLSEHILTGAETRAKNHQVLQLVTGLDEHETLNSPSLRSFIMQEMQCPKEVAERVCNSYAALLGQLGATRTLSKESESSNEMLRNSCMRLLKDTSKPSAMPDVQGLPIEQCVTMDYLDLAKQMV